jgi:Cytochrome oxidase complex assembly protein 1
MVDQRIHIEQEAIPAEIDRWNWGAFLLNWIWGVGNNTFIALLTLIPFIGLIMPFVLGAKGSAWAWRNGRWDSVEHFKRVQRSWAIWGAVVWLGFIVLFGGIIGGTFYILEHSEAYERAASILQTSPEVAKLLGTPVSTGIPMGSIRTSGSSGRAILSFSASGPKATGHVFLDAIKTDSVWSIRTLTLKVDGREGTIDLLKLTKADIEGSRSRVALAFRDHDRGKLPARV